MASLDQKPSRYRSQRSANPAATLPFHSDPSSDLAGVDDNVAGTVNRNRSRYHRKAGQRGDMTSPVVSGSPELTISIPQDRVMSPRAEADRQRRLAENSASRQGSGGWARDTRHDSHDARHMKDYGPVRYDSPMVDHAPSTIRPGVSQAPQQILATTVDVQQEKGASCFGGLFRRKKDVLTLEQPEKARETKPGEPQFIKHGGGGVVPGTDAPKSAVNSGDRRVLVECNRNSMQFPVDPTTTAGDLLQSAANCFSESIDPKTSVLVELFTKVGVQRPLRRYEHIRDVMNSWDDDRQNTLIVMPATGCGSDPALLHLSHVPTGKPAERSFAVYYSQKVGKWDRRHIIIRSDGQVVAKKNSTASDKEAANVCHLSDFDVYVPTQRQMSKKIRPPKKLCFAIKSQQKTTMFETTTDFVHFFCTGEREDAIGFYTAVQSWRSWYLVNVKGAGRKGAAQPDPFKQSPVKSKSVKKTQHARDQSMESAYQLGSFKPLLDTEKVDLSQADVDASRPTRRSSRREPHRNVSMPEQQQQLGENEPLGKLRDKRASADEARAPGTFASAGLLGRTYSQRQRDQAARDASAAQPFTAGTNLLSSSIMTSPNPQSSNRHSNPRASLDLHRSHSRRAAKNSVDLTRNPSVRAGGPQAKPLVDLTPTYREPAQHARKSGRAAAAPATGGPLIDAVPSPDDPFGIPPSTDLRGRNGPAAAAAQHQPPSSSSNSSSPITALPDQALGGGGGGYHHQQQQQPSRQRARSTSRSRPAAATTNTITAPRFQNASAYAALTGAEQPSDININSNGGGGGGGGITSGTVAAFVPGGLLEQAAGGWGAGDKGRGVGKAGTVGRPLLDLGEQEVYGKGSLLERAARAEGIRAPIIDRDGG